MHKHVFYINTISGFALKYKKQYPLQEKRLNLDHVQHSSFRTVLSCLPVLYRVTWHREHGNAIMAYAQQVAALPKFIKIHEP